ncbi:MAG: hypothetical protein JWM45_4077 [Pseudonocardiales bacterium]|nr:hypothetical protein [Pseudonocardiales bacterium]
MTADQLEQDATITRSSFWHLPEQRSCRTSGAGRDAQVRRLVGVIEETRRREGAVDPRTLARGDLRRPGPQRFGAL